MTTVINQIVPDGEQAIKIVVRDNERGPAGKDGAIQYTAGSGIKITDENVISVFGQAGGSVDWGTIGGTLADQTDLANALTAVETACNDATDLKLANYTPATDLATVATTGAYSDLSGTPTVPVFTLTTTDPGEDATLAANNFIAVYEA